MKFLVWIALFLIVLWVVRKLGAARATAARSQAPRAPESMVKCSLCGVNQPISESTLSAGKYYCCNEHRQEAEAARK